MGDLALQVRMENTWGEASRSEGDLYGKYLRLVGVVRRNPAEGETLVVFEVAEEDDGVAMLTQMLMDSQVIEVAAKRQYAAWAAAR